MRASSCQSSAVSKVAQILWRMEGGILRAAVAVCCGATAAATVQQSPCCCARKGSDSFPVFRRKTSDGRWCEDRGCGYERKKQKKKRRMEVPLKPLVPGGDAHLGHDGVDLQDLLLTFDLPHADLAGELRGSGGASLQGEGTVQGLLVTAPHLGEGELLVE